MELEYGVARFPPRRGLRERMSPFVATVLLIGMILIGAVLLVMMRPAPALADVCPPNQAWCRGIKLSSSSVDVDEGSTTTYGVKLRYYPTYPYGTVTVSVYSYDTGAATVSPSSLTFTTSNWDNYKYVTVTGRSDSDLTDETVSISHSANVTGYPSETVTAYVEDTTTSGSIVLSSSSVDVDEDSDAYYGVKLSARPSGTVTVSVYSYDTGAATVSPSSLTFTTSNWNSYQYVWVSGVSDSDLTDETVSIRNRASGYTDRWVTADVEDTTTSGSIVLSSSSVDVDEDSDAYYGVKLSARPSGTVTVSVYSYDTGAATVSPSSLTFTTSNWNSYKYVWVSGVSDSDLTDETVSIRNRASGYTDRWVTADVEDTTTSGSIVLSSSSVDVDEGSTTYYGVKLRYYPTYPYGTVTVSVYSYDTGAATVSPSSLTFTTSNWNSYQYVWVSGVSDSDLTDETVSISHSANVTGYPSETVTAYVEDTTTSGSIVLSSSSVDVDEDSDAYYGVKLSARPSGTVTVSVYSYDTGAATVSPSSLTFTTSNWNSYQYVWVSGVSDSDLTDETVSIRNSASGYTSQWVAAYVEDTTTSGSIVLSSSSVDVDEDSDAYYGVKLSARPSGTVTVSVYSYDTGAATVSPSSLTFTTSNWNSYQYVWVSGVSDSDLTDETVSIRNSASGYTSQWVAAYVEDTTTSGSIVLSSSSVDVDEDSDAYYGVKLSARPSGTVTVSVYSYDTGAATVSPSSLTFTTSNWNSYQYVWVSGVSDSDLTDETVSIRNSASGYTSQWVAAYVEDTTTSGSIVLSSSSVDVDEDSDAYYGVKLSARPSGTVTVSVYSYDTGAATVSPSSLTFTTSNWNSYQYVWVSGVSDSDLTDETVSIRNSASGYTSQWVAAYVEDTTTSGSIVLSSSSVDVDEGSTTYYGVKLSARPSGTVTVSVYSYDTGAATVSPSSLTFTTSNWNSYQYVWVSGVSDSDLTDETVSIRNSASGYTSQWVAAYVEDTTTSGSIVLSSSSVDVDEDSDAYYGVKLSARPSGTVTVSVYSYDTGAATVSPSSLTFTTSNWNSYQYVWVSGVSDSDLTDETVSIRNSASGYTSQWVAAYVEDTTTSGSIVLSSSSVDVDEGSTTYYGVKLSARPSGTVTVSVYSYDTGAATVSPSSLTFTTSNWNSYQYVWVSGVSDSDLTDETVSIRNSASGYTSQWVAAYVEDTTTSGSIVLSSSSVDVDEDSDAYYGVKLSARPSGTVTVSVYSYDTGAATVSPSSLTFTTSNWNSYQYVWVSGVSDSDQTDETVSIRNSASGYTSQWVTADVEDTTIPSWCSGSVDVTGGSVSGSWVSDCVSANRSGSYARWYEFSIGESREVTIDLESAGTDTYLFLLGSDGQVIEEDDDGGEGTGTNSRIVRELAAGTYTVEATTYAAGTAGAFTLSITAPVSVTVPGVPRDLSAVSSASGSSVSLSWSAPSDDGGATITGYEYRYKRSSNSSTWWSSWLSVGSTSKTVSGLSSGVSYDFEVRAVNSQGEGSAASRTVTTLATPVVVVSQSLLSVGEGLEASYTVSLSSVPSGSVTIVISEGSDAISVSHSQIILRADDWSSGREVTVRGWEDADTEDETATITHTAPGSTETVSVTVVDNDVPSWCSGSVDVTGGSGSVSGSWVSDCVSANRSGSYARWYDFTLGEDGEVTIDLESGTDPYLFLLGSDGQVIGEDDDGGEGTNSRIVRELAAGTYTVEATTYAAGTTGDFTLSITAPVSVTVPGVPRDLSAVSSASGSSVSLSWSAPSDDGGATITGYEYRYKRSSNSSTWWPSWLSVGSTSKTVSGLSSGVSYDFEVRAVNSQGEGSAASRTVTTLATPVVVVSQSSLSVGEGLEASYTVSLSSVPSGSVTIVISEGSDAISVSHSQIILRADDWSSGREVTVRGWEDADTEDETATITHTAPGSTETVSVTVVDNDVPSWCSGSVDVTGGSGSVSDSWVSSCESANRSGSYARWYDFTLGEDGEVTIDLESGTDPYLFLLGSDGQVIGEDDDGGEGTNSRIVRELAAGTYTVEATTYAAGTTGAFTLSITAPVSVTVPGVPRDLSAVSSASGSSVSLSWSAPSSDGGATISGYEYRYRRSSNSRTWWSSWLSVGSTSKTVSGLSSGVSYDFEVRAVNSQGEGSAASRTVTTSSSVTVPGAPGRPSASSVTSSSIVWSWDAPSSNGGATITGYEVRGRPSGGSWSSWDSNGVSGRAITITGLTPGSSYDLEARARNSVGPGSASLTGSATTVSVPGRPGRPYASSVTGSSIVWSWDAPSSNGGATITGYEVRGRPSGGSWSSWDSNGGADRAITITGLTPGSSYDLEARARNSVGAGSASLTGSATTVSVPGRPGRPYASSVTGSSIVWSWDAPSSNGGATITGYEVRGRPSGGSWSSWNSNGGADRAITITGLTPGSSYDLEARARNSVGPGSASLTGSATTVSVPGRPGRPYASSVTGSSIVWSWDAPSSNGGATITDYERRSRPKGGEGWSRWVSNGGADRAIKITGLSPGCSYDVQVRAVSSSGIGLESDIGSYTTAADLVDVSGGRLVWDGWSDACASQMRTSEGGEGHYGRQFRFTLNSTTKVRIDLQSQVDNYLYLLDSRGTVVAEDDNGGNGHNARIDEELPFGTYTVEATTFDPQTIGDFTLIVIPPPGVPGTPVAKVTGPTVDGWTINWEWEAAAAKGASELGYEFKWRRAGEDWPLDWDARVTSPTTFELLVDVAGEYQLKVRAVNIDTNTRGPESEVGSAVIAGTLDTTIIMAEVLDLPQDVSVEELMAYILENETRIASFSVKEGDIQNLNWRGNENTVSYTVRLGSDPGGYVEVVVDSNPVDYLYVEETPTPNTLLRPNTYAILDFNSDSWWFPREVTVTAVIEPSRDDWAGKIYHRYGDARQPSLATLTVNVSDKVGVPRAPTLLDPAHYLPSRVPADTYDADEDVLAWGWHAPEDTGGRPDIDIDSYNYEWVGKAGTFSGTTEHVRVDTRSVYGLRVRAKNRYGFGHWSELKAATVIPVSCDIESDLLHEECAPRRDDRDIMLSPSGVVYGREGSTLSYDVWLGSPPPEDTIVHMSVVVVSETSHSVDVLTHLLVFDSVDWHRPQKVNLRIEGDGDRYHEIVDVTHSLTCVSLICDVDYKEWVQGKSATMTVRVTDTGVNQSASADKWVALAGTVASYGAYFVAVAFLPAAPFAILIAGAAAVATKVIAEQFTQDNMTVTEFRKAVGGAVFDVMFGYGPIGKFIGRYSVKSYGTLSAGVGDLPTIAWALNPVYNEDNSTWQTYSDYFQAIYFKPRGWVPEKALDLALVPRAEGAEKIAIMIDECLEEDSGCGDPLEPTPPPGSCHEWLRPPIIVGWGTDEVKWYHSNPEKCVKDIHIVYYNSDPNYNTETIVTLPNGDFPGYGVFDMPDNTIGIRAWLTHSGNVDLNSQDIYRDTLVSVPGVPGMPSASSVTDSSVVWSWLAPTSGGAVSSYDYQLYENESWGSWHYVGDTTSKTTSGLSPGTDYFFRVKAHNSSGPGAESPFGSATTSVRVDPGACKVNAGQVTLPWAVSDTVVADCSIGYVTARRIHYFQAEQSGTVTVANTTLEGEADLRLKEADGFGENRANLTDRISAGESATAEVEAGQWYALMLLGSTDGQTISGTVTASG